MSVEDFWSITGDKTEDALLLIPLGILVIATMMTTPGTDKASVAYYVVLALDIAFLLVLVTLWMRHLTATRRSRR